MVREYGSEHISGAGKPRPIGCGCGRKLMVAAVQLARMSCTQRQRSGGAERDEAHVPGDVVLTGRVGAASWDSRVGVAVVEIRNVMVTVVQLPWTSCHVC